jgi:hypothetical protein
VNGLAAKVRIFETADDQVVCNGIHSTGRLRSSEWVSWPTAAMGSESAWRDQAGSDLAKVRPVTASGVMRT